MEQMNEPQYVRQEIDQVIFTGTVTKEGSAFIPVTLPDPELMLSDVSFIFTVVDSNVYQQYPDKTSARLGFVQQVLFTNSEGQLVETAASVPFRRTLAKGESDTTTIYRIWFTQWAPNKFAGVKVWADMADWVDITLECRLQYAYNREIQWYEKIGLWFQNLFRSIIPGGL